MLETIANAITWAFEKVLVLIVTVIFGLISVIAPDFASEITGAYATLVASDVGYFLGIMQIPAGLGMLITAYIARFFVRRLPYVG